MPVVNADAMVTAVSTDKPFFKNVFFVIVPPVREYLYTKQPERLSITALAGNNKHFYTMKFRISGD